MLTHLQLNFLLTVSDAQDKNLENTKLMFIDTHCGPILGWKP